MGQQIIERTYGSLLIYGLLFLFFFWSAIRSRSPRAGWSNNGVMRYDTLLELNAVSKQFGQNRVLDEVSLTVNPGK